MKPGVSILLASFPRPPHSRMRTLKLCRQGEAGVFSHVSSVKGRKGVKKTLVACGRTRKPRKSESMLHVSHYWCANILHTEH